MQDPGKNNSYVVLIGGANLDILGFPDKTLIPRDSNPGTIRFSTGGFSLKPALNLEEDISSTYIAIMDSVTKSKKNQAAPGKSPYPEIFNHHGRSDNCR